MKKYSYCLLVALVIPVLHYAQTAVNKILPVQQGQKITMHFDYPEMIRISTWDKNEISIQGSVTINGGENDDAFELHTATNGNIINVSNEIKNMKNLPQRITVVRDGQKIMFRDKAELKKYQAEHGAAFERQSWGVEMEIILEIKVPRGVETKVESVYGFVEVKDYNGPLTAISTYGGVDAALAEKQIGEISAETNYGEIYTNFDTRFGGKENDKAGDFYTYVSAKPGNGPRYSFESKYGNVYLRKSN
jgi:hypothetical protein